MIQKDLQKTLLKIVVFWENLIKEHSDDPDSYDFISTQSITLKMISLDLKNLIDGEIRKNKKAKLKYQKLRKSLENIVQTLDFKLEIYKDKEYIEYILNKLSQIKKDIDIVKQYQ